MMSVPRWLRLLVVVTGLLVALLAQTAAREWRLHRGEVIRLAAVPVDPWDQWRGAYVALDYAVLTPAPVDIPGGAALKGLPAGTPVWLLIRRDDPDHPRQIALSPPQTGEGEVLLRAETSDPASGRPVRLRFPDLERYYLEQDAALALEQAVRQQRLSVEVVLAGDGTPALRGLWLEGRRITDERLLAGDPIVAAAPLNQE